jgi:hypothetical protein
MRYYRTCNCCYEFGASNYWDTYGVLCDRCNDFLLKLEIPKYIPQQQKLYYMRLKINEK